MESKERILGEILNSKQMLTMLIHEIEKLEQRYISGAITHEEALDFGQRWEISIQMQYKHIDLLKSNF